MKKKRLTFKDGIGKYDLIVCKNCDPGEGARACGLCDYFQQAIDRLAEYEETGLLPNEVSKLKKKQEG